jgi:hypothetical protein
VNNSVYEPNEERAPFSGRNCDRVRLADGRESELQISAYRDTRPIVGRLPSRASVLLLFIYSECISNCIFSLEVAKGRLLSTLVTHHYRQQTVTPDSLAIPTIQTREHYCHSCRRYKTLRFLNGVKRRNLKKTIHIIQFRCLKSVKMHSFLHGTGSSNAGQLYLSLHTHLISRSVRSNIFYIKFRMVPSSDD